MPVIGDSEVRNISSRHPLYNEFYGDWVTVRDCYRGSRVVKQKGTTYLPATESMHQDGLGPSESGGRAYSSYKLRANFPDIVNDAVEAMLGVMWHKPPVIELPAIMEPLRKTATLKHESLDMLLRRVNEEQLVGGRLGLLLDLPQDPTLNAETSFYLAMYRTEDIVNWAELQAGAGKQADVDLVVLDESEYERRQENAFSWYKETKYRVLTLDEGVYKQGLYREYNETYTSEGMVVPSVRGKSLGEIPFVFINSNDIDPEPEEPPLLGLAELALTVYRGEADYRQSLFLQGQDTLVIIGGTDDEEYRIGAGNAIKIPSGPGHDAKFVGVSSDGLEEQRLALQNDRVDAMRKSGQMLDDTSREKESGEALTVRVAAKTATLNQLAITGAFGFERALKIGAAWMGANPDEVSVTPNLDFVDDTLSARELVEFMTAKATGGPISLRTVHKNMSDKGVTDMSFEDEIKAIEEEKSFDLLPSLDDDLEGSPEDD